MNTLLVFFCWLSVGLILWCWEVCHCSSVGYYRITHFIHNFFFAKCTEKQVFPYVGEHFAGELLNGIGTSGMFLNYLKVVWLRSLENTFFNSFETKQGGKLVSLLLFVFKWSNIIWQSVGYECVLRCK